MNSLLTALIWIGGPALFLGAFAVVLPSVGAGQRWAIQRWKQCTHPVSPGDQSDMTIPCLVTPVVLWIAGIGAVGGTLGTLVLVVLA